MESDHPKEQRTRKLAPTDRIAVRRAEAIKLRVLGKGYQEIADTLGVGLATAHSDVKFKLDEAAKEATDAAREALAIDIQRLDLAIALALREVQAGNLSAIDRVVKVQERRAKLLGLDSPERIDATLSEGPSPEMAARLVREAFRTEETHDVSDGSGRPSTPAATTD